MRTSGWEDRPTTVRTYVETMTCDGCGATAANVEKHSGAGEIDVDPDATAWAAFRQLPEPAVKDLCPACATKVSQLIAGLK